MPKGADMVTTPAESAQPEISARPTTDSIAPSGAAQLRGRTRKSGGVSPFPQLLAAIRLTGRLRAWPGHGTFVDKA